MQVWGGSGVADAAVSTTGLDVCLYCNPCGGDREGGDVHERSSYSSGRITQLVLADVRGHGEGVVWLSRSLRRLVQRHIDHPDHGTLVHSINQAFVSVGDVGTFATGLIATFFVPTRMLSHTNAGHPPPLLCRAESRQWAPLVGVSSPSKKPPVSAAPANVPLGLFESTMYGKTQVKLGPDDLLLSFTDGLEECVMPHVVVEQAGPLEVVCAAFDPFAVADGNLILRISDAFINQRGTSMRLEAIVVDTPRPQTCFVQLSQRDQAVTVRLLPATDPEEKTTAVKRLMAQVAHRIRQVVPESRYGKTNLQEFLIEPDA